MHHMKYLTNAAFIAQIPQSQNARAEGKTAFKLLFSKYSRAERFQHFSPQIPARTARIASALGKACTNKIRREAVAAP